MLASALYVFLCATAALASVARNPSAPPRCSTTISDEKVAEVEQNFAANKVSRSLEERAATLNVFFHVISKDNSGPGGNIPDGLILRQMQVLNDGFSSTGLAFRLVGIDRTMNSDWFDNAAPGSPQEQQMKTALRKGGAANLNVYSVGFNGADHSGYSTYPWGYNAQPWRDGVVILYATMPGFSLTGPYNLGKTLIHEVGHWVGLLHTFQGGCTPPGDLVEDTAPEASAALGCQTGPPRRDTCPGGGPDPIHNYMDFSDDACVNQFTFGQSARLTAALRQYRGV